MATFKLETKNPIIPRKKIAPGKFATTDLQQDLINRNGERNLRRSRYGNIGEQLDMLWHDIESGRIVADTESANTWFQHIQGIKDEIPLTELKISNSSMEIVISSHNPSEQ